jgi:hypothetical protein
MEDMIKQGQIAAQYFASTMSVAFDQKANEESFAKFLTDLEGEFTAWGKAGKKE